MQRIIKNGQVLDETWHLLPADATLDSISNSDDLIVPLALWREHAHALKARDGGLGVWLEAGEEIEEIVDQLDSFQVIALNFPAFTDGRHCSSAYLLRNRYGYTVAAVGGANEGFRGLLKYDFEKGGSVEHDFGPGCATGEGVFVPAGPRAGEDEGYVLSFVHDEATNGSRLVVLDAHDFAKPPLAEVPLPQRVPFGFHGNWVPDLPGGTRPSP